MKVFSLSTIFGFLTRPGEIGAPGCDVCHLPPDRMPEVAHPMQLIQLGSPVVAPDGFLAGIVNEIAPGAELKRFDGSKGLEAFDGNRLVAYESSDTGEIRVFPSFEGLAPGEELNDQATRIAFRFANNQSLFPPDRSHIVLLPPVVISGSSKTGTKGNATPPAEYMAFVRLERRIDKFPVFGPGYLAMIGVASNESVRAMAYRWRPASSTKR